MHTLRDGSTKLVGIAFDVTGDMLMTQQLQAAKREAEAKNVELELTSTASNTMHSTTR